MVMDVMDMDLQALMRSGQALSEQHVQFFMAQILSALECIHDVCVVFLVVFFSSSEETLI